MLKIVMGLLMISMESTLLQMQIKWITRILNFMYNNRVRAVALDGNGFNAQNQVVLESKPLEAISIVDYKEDN